VAGQCFFSCVLFVGIWANKYCSVIYLDLVLQHKKLLVSREICDHGSFSGIKLLICGWLIKDWNCLLTYFSIFIFEKLKKILA
jgi:hypothetical protein